MKTSPLGSSAVRVACFVALASSPSLSQIRAETAAEHKLTVYRQTYAQLIELGLRPTEAATEARKVALDDANWVRNQGSKGAGKAEGGAREVSVSPDNGKGAKAPNATEPAKAPSKSTFDDEKDAPLIALTPATARPVVRQALEELKVAMKDAHAGTNGVPTPTFDLILQKARDSRLGSTGAALLENFANLTNVWAKIGTLKAGQTNELKANTKAIEKETAKAAGNLEVLLSTNKFTPKAFLHVGYVTLNPFTFVPDGSSPKEYKLDDGSTSAAYVEFQYNNRWAWNWLEPGPAELRQLNWVNPFSRQSDLDLQARFGYSFISAATNEVSSIVGGGNINGEFTVGAPFLKYQNDWVRYSIDLEATYGMSADRSDFDIHSTFMVGAGYHASIDSDFFPGKVLLSLHLGVGFVEVPDIIEPKNGTVSVDLGRANFDARWGVVGMTFETLLPLNASTYVVAGGRLYGNADPNPWSAYIGISKELGSLRRIFADDPVTGDPK